MASGLRRVLAVLPTGGGKTIVAAELVRRAVAGGKRVLFLAHKRELVQQASRKLFAAGIDHGIVAAGFTGRAASVQVASVPTLHSRAVRSSKIDLPPADLIIVDEAHHANATTWRRILDAYPEAQIVGFSATPARGDGRGLGVVFQAMVEGPTIKQLIDLGHLVGTRVFAPTVPDLAAVEVRRTGDYHEGQLAEIMDRPKLTGDIVTHYHRLAGGQKAVVFATSREHGAHLCHEFNLSGVPAGYVDGETPTPERDRILRMLVEGGLDVVVNVGCLVEGWDCPEVRVLVLARPTKSLGLYLQILGRGLRPAPGKTHCLVLDHAGATLEHGFAEEPTRWTLDANQRAERPQRATRSKNQPPRLLACPECAAVRCNWQPCENCGWRPPPRRSAVDMIEGDLGEVDRTRKVKPLSPSQAAREAFHRQLLWFANERGYRPGWAAHKFKEKFGDWPHGTPTPMEPTPEVRSWIRSRTIAYAKARQNERGAA